jgi:hypothetical protein
LVNKKLLAVSYCFAFLSVYLISIAYAAAALYFKESFKTNLPATDTIALNASMSAVSSFSSWSSISYEPITIIVTVVAIIILLSSARAMSQAV